jgi:hypothetical protein
MRCRSLQPDDLLLAPTTASTPYVAEGRLAIYSLATLVVEALSTWDLLLEARGLLATMRRIKVGNYSIRSNDSSHVRRETLLVPKIDYNDKKTYIQQRGFASGHPPDY